MRAFTLAIAVTAIVAVGCGETNQPQPAASDTQPVSFNADGRPTIEIDVPGLECEHCSAAACSLLADIPGVVDVKADPATKRATVAIDQSEFDGETARAALEDRFGEATIVDNQTAGDTAEQADPS